jgi:hypothetical protein
MANGGRKSLPRRILEAADAFASSFSDAELKLFGAFGALLGGKALKHGRYLALTRRRIQRELARVVDNICVALEEEAAQVARQALLTAYAATAETIADEIEAFAVQTEVEAERAQREMIKIVDELTRLVNESTQIELKHMRRDADDIYRQIVEKVRDAWLEPGNASKLNAEVQEAIREFAASGVTGFTDKAGRKWGLYEYANMAMRTAIHRAGLQATIDTMRAKGQDLAYVTRHPGACPLCARWYGVILSLSGDDPTHPSLQGAMDQGLFHPNCADVLQPYIPGVSDLTAGMGEYTPEESAARYTASQHQRTLEREIRKWKRMQAASTTPENERMCKAHIDKLQRQLRTLTGETKLPRRYDREGGRVLLSADAKKLKPFTVGENGRIIQNIATNPAITKTDAPNASTKASENSVNFICKIDRSIYSCVSKDITTDEVVITEERIQHIKERHPNDYERYYSYIAQILRSPDYILEDKVHTGLILKEIKEDDKMFRLVLRLSTSTDNPEYKNSVLTFMETNRKKWEQNIRNKKVLYKRDEI